MWRNEFSNWSFVWNPEKKEFLQRTGSNWFKIFVFYVIFYGCLIGIFMGTIRAMQLTLSEYKPNNQDRVAPPGLSHTPRSEQYEIAFSLSDVTSYQKHIDSIKALLEMYEEDKQTKQMKFEDCGGTPQTYKDRGSLESGAGQRKACRFRKTWLNACSGDKDPTFGYKEGKPCLIVKLNRIINFRPRIPSNNQSLPEALQGKVMPNLIPIHCNTKKEKDADKIGQIKYFGLGGGFPLQYYPYYGKLLQPQYLQPLVAIRFENITLDEMLHIECKAYGANIDYSEKYQFQGRFNVKIKIRS